MFNNKKKEKLKWENILPGVALCLLIAFPSWYLGKIFPIMGAPVVAILIGILITTIFPKLTTRSLFEKEISFSQGVKYTSKKMLQYSIILLGFEMNLFNVIKVGSESLIVMVFTLSAAFITAYVMGNVLKLSGNMTVLVGVGTSICGGSAIAATAPVIRASDEDVASSISTIFLFNIIAVFIFPLLGHIMGMNDKSFGMWAGTAINDTSSVVAAGTSWSMAAGNTTALQFATIVKLTRTLMIVPITLFLAIYTARKRKQSDGNDFSFAKVFPWFVIYFALAAVVNTFASAASNGNFGIYFVSFGKSFVGLSVYLVTLGKFVIVMAMSAIGLNTNLKKLLTNGIKPIFLGSCCWLAVAVVALIVRKFIIIT